MIGAAKNTHEIVAHRMSRSGKEAAKVGCGKEIEWAVDGMRDVIFTHDPSSKRL